MKISGNNFVGTKTKHWR